MSSEEKSITITGRLSHIKWSDDNIIIGALMTDAGTEYNFKGFLPCVYKGDSITLHGDWFSHPRFGKQIDVRWFEFAEPSECSEEQLKLSDACKFIFLELELEKRGEKIFQTYKGEARKIITENPYCIAQDVPDVGFKTAEKVAQKLGVGQYDPRRIDSKVLEILQKATYETGHHFLPWSRLVHRASEELEIDYEVIEESINRLAEPTYNFFGKQLAPHVALEKVDELTLVYPHYLFIAEKRLSERIYKFLRDPCTSIELDEEELSVLRIGDKTIELSDEQQEAVRLALREPLSIITGGPGVGKTTIVKKIVEVCVSRNLQVDLCSFTGRASRRLEEAAGRPASTIHRLLGYDPRSSHFKMGPNNTLPSKVIICDETSMVNLYMGSKLFDAIESGARLVLVGDADQLPPIGPGALFRELINSGSVPTMRLQKIFRQAESSLIIRTSRTILEKRIPASGVVADNDDFYIFGYQSPESGLAMILKLVTEKIPKMFGIRSEDIQVLAPIYKGDVGIWKLNQELQKALRGTNASKDLGFLANDKVIYTKNDHDIGVMNGDMGKVIRTGKRVAAIINDQEYIFEKDQQKNLQLAYAMSVHKSQGSEYPAVIVVASPGGPPGFFNRNMLYTAITRGKELSIVVTPNGYSTLKVIIETDEKRRNSRLTTRLQEHLNYEEPPIPTLDLWDLETQREVLSSF